VALVAQFNLAHTRRYPIQFLNDRAKCSGVGNFAPFLPLNWLPWQRPLRNWKNGPDQENSRKYLPFGEKIVKIGLVDTEIALLRVKK